MGFTEYYCFILIVIVKGICLRAQSQYLVTTCDPNDVRALRGFMAVLQNRPESWELNSSSIDCCKWEGVTCEGRRVVKLELPTKRLTGKLSHSVGSLDQLRILNLSHNFLEKSLPTSLFEMSNLQVLDLSFNDFYGPVPDFVKLSSIQHLDMSQNLLNGSLPGRVCGSSELKVLKLSANHFSGEVPLGFGDCHSMEQLSLRENDISGISKALFRLRKLSDLDLSDNNLSGRLSRGIGNLTNLVRLDISSNALLGSIPDVFHMLGKLQTFIAHSNNFHGNIPNSLTNSPTLSLLNLKNNSLGDTINLNCSALLSLATLSLSTNRFHGPIPNTLPSCRHLKNVDLSQNDFTGEIPVSFKDFHTLHCFSLSNTNNTNLSSALRILHHCKNLTILVLSLNFQDDALPADPDLHFERLKVLVIANCRLTGSVPQWLHRSERLQLLDLSWNRLVGTLPGWLGDFQFLFYLDLSNNSFTDGIPKTLTRLTCLISRDIQMEEPSLHFPFIKKRNVRDQGLQYNRLWSFPPTLDLSHNHLSGPILPEFGNLRKLHVFDLKFNNLSGPIPSSLSRMSSLESLDLSRNNLSGTIPSTLGTLTFLSEFSVAFNKLYGPVPMAGQFSTFPSSSFEGNALCGLQTAKLCGSSEGDPSEQSACGESDFVNAVGVGVGIGTAFGFVFGAVLFQVFTVKYGMFKT